MEAKNGCLILIIIAAFIGGVLVEKSTHIHDSRLIDTQWKEIVRQDSVINYYKLKLDDCMLTRKEIDRIVKLIEEVR